MYRDGITGRVLRGGGLTGTFIGDAVDPPAATAAAAAAAAAAAGGGAKFKVTNGLDPEFTVDQCEPLPSATLRLCNNSIHQINSSNQFIKSIQFIPSIRRHSSAETAARAAVQTGAVATGSDRHREMVRAVNRPS